LEGRFTARNSGIVSMRLRRRSVDRKKIEAARRELAKGMSVFKTVRLVDLGAGTVQRFKQVTPAAG
jgi:hypothetical protein